MRMRIVCHAQHLSGVGHYARMRAIAHGLAGAHEVHLVEGGRAVPCAPEDAAPRVIALPRITRLGDALVGLDEPGDAAAVMATRIRRLVEAVERIRPHALLIDHYPFSKWELGDEITAMIDSARAAHPSVLVACSLRDVARQTRHERLAPAAYEARVLEVLEDRFDVLLVHADPLCTRLEEHFAHCAEIHVPIHYTGIVVAAEPPLTTPPRQGPYAVLSCGGGAWNTGFLLGAMQAYARLADSGAVGSMPLLVFAAAFASDADLAMLGRAAAAGPFEVRPFVPDFAAYLSRATLSISRAGYNTCAAVLQTGVRAVLAPDPKMSDQLFRAARLEALGLATSSSADIDALRAAMRRALQGSPGARRLDLGGVAGTRALIEELGRP